MLALWSWALRRYYSINTVSHIWDRRPTCQFPSIKLNPRQHMWSKAVRAWFCQSVLEHHLSKRKKMQKVTTFAHSSGCFLVGPCWTVGSTAQLFWSIVGHDHLNWLPTDIRIWHSVPGYLYIVWSLDLLVASVCCVSDDALTLWLVRFSDRLILHWHVGSDRILQLRLDTKEITFAGVSTSTEDLLRWQWLREGLSIWQKTVRQGLVSVELFGQNMAMFMPCGWILFEKGSLLLGMHDLCTAFYSPMERIPLDIPLRASKNWIGLIVWAW